MSRRTSGLIGFYIWRLSDFIMKSYGRVPSTHLEALSIARESAEIPAEGNNIVLEFSFTRLIVEDMLFHWKLLQGPFRTHHSLWLESPKAQCSTFQSWDWWCTKGKVKVNRFLKPWRLTNFTFHFLVHLWASWECLKHSSRILSTPWRPPLRKKREFSHKICDGGRRLPAGLDAQEPP
jgi:hypothetical protein